MEIIMVSLKKKYYKEADRNREESDVETEAETRMIQLQA